MAEPSSTASAPTNAEFLATIFDQVPQGACAVVIGKPGDPNVGGWVPRHAERVADVCPATTNTYFNCASLIDRDGELAARKDSAAAYHALVLDDVGTKVSRDRLGDVKATWELETSPGNFQIGFKLAPAITDAKAVEAFQAKVADAGLTDKGALGMVRWARLPNGINGKPAYEKEGKPFDCQLHAWNPAAAYSADSLAKAFGLPDRPAPKLPAGGSAGKATGQARPARGQVYVPRTAENPIVAAFEQRGLYKRLISPGKHEVTCPWLQEHTGALDTGAAYFEPDEAYPSGGFCCQHSHKDEYHIGEVLEYFGLSEVEGRHKPLIRIVPGEMNAILAATEEVLAARGDLYQAGDVIVSVTHDPVSGDATITPVGEAALTLALSAASDWERFDGRKQEWVRSDPPPRHVAMLYKAQTYAKLPVLRGLARQPYYDDEGSLHTTAGYDPTSQRIGVFDASKFNQPATSETAAREALTLLEDLLCEFHFASEVDRSAAIAAIFTAVTRPALELAPAFHVAAPTSGTGKSFLCETIASFGGPGGSSRVSYPKTSEEATKAMLSLLLAAPAVIEFDDMDTDWIPFGAINRMLTSRSITDRILGVSKTATVSTSALVLGSGNNVGPIRDLARRVVTINLNARSETPGTLTYRGNPTAALKADRERYVMAVLTIIEAWQAAGAPKTAVPSIASYSGSWSHYCRQPLLWLGLPDPGTALLEQMKTDPDADNLLRLLEEWHKEHGDQPLTLRKLLGDTYGESALQEALLDLPVVEKGSINRSRLGHFLKRNRDRIVGGFMLQKVPNSERNAWRVVKVETGDGPATPPSPPSPASTQLDAQTEQDPAAEF